MLAGHTQGANMGTLWAPRRLPFEQIFVKGRRDFTPETQRHSEARQTTNDEWGMGSAECGVVAMRHVPPVLLPSAFCLPPTNSSKNHTPGVPGKVLPRRPRKNQAFAQHLGITWSAAKRGGALSDRAEQKIDSEVSPRSVHSHSSSLIRSCGKEVRANLNFVFSLSPRGRGPG